MLIETAMREADRLLADRLERLPLLEDAELNTYELIEALRDEVLSLRECVKSARRNEAAVLAHLDESDAKLKQIAEKVGA